MAGTDPIVPDPWFEGPHEDFVEVMPGNILLTSPSNEFAFMTWYIDWFGWPHSDKQNKQDPGPVAVTGQKSPSPMKMLELAYLTGGTIFNDGLDHKVQAFEIEITEQNYAAHVELIFDQGVLDPEVPNQ